MKSRTDLVKVICAVVKNVSVFWRLSRGDATSAERQNAET